MSKDSMSSDVFDILIARIRQETNYPEKKLEILYTSRGYFNASQAAQILHELSGSKEKISALRMLEPRLCRMSCRDARQIVEAVSIHNDRLIALDCVKRVLTDSDSDLGGEYSLSSFIYENDKNRGRSIQQTVSSRVSDHIAAGGHQGYASLGTLYSQSRPMLPNLYGDMVTQVEQTPGHGKVATLPSAHLPVPSVYSGHPSYAYPPDTTYAEVRNYPGSTGNPADSATLYPGGAPPLGYHSGAPAPTGFYNLEEVGVWDIKFPY